MVLDWYYPRPELAKSYLEEFSRRAPDAWVTDQIVPHDAPALHDETNMLQYRNVCNRIALDRDHVSQFPRVQ